MLDYNPEVDYYEILQVHPGAHAEVIKRAYYTIVKLLQAHPDLGGAHEDAVRVNEAYAVLSDPAKRQAYDAARRQQARPAAMRPTARQTTRPPRTAHVRVQAESMQTVYCPRCGVRNRVPRMVNLAQAVCGKCRAPLQQRADSVREPLPSGAVRLPPTSAARLQERGELRVQRMQPTANHRYRCLRCRKEWAAPGSLLPATCPYCHTTRWSDFRLFTCRYCAHQFTTTRLRGWPYRLFAECPACHRTHWHAGCEQHPLRWLLNWLRHR